jgi:TolB-like protein/Tfp pilus assembly protein PilF
MLGGDVVGYSRLMAEDEEATIRVLAAHRDTIRERVHRHAGRIVDFRGDDFLAELPTALAAATAAVEIQQAIAAHQRVHAGDGPAGRMQLRLGVHLGDIRVEDGRVYGDAVNIAARLESLAPPGGICLSSSVYEQVRRKLPVYFEDLGERIVKNISEPLHVYCIRLDRRSTDSAGSAAQVGGERKQGGALGSVAVLPLENLSGDPGQDYFADGMTEALIGDLARIESLRVISRTSVMRYKGARRLLPEIAAELGVDAIVEGSIMRAGDRVRINVRLIDARTEHHLLAARFERELADVLELENEVARALVAKIEVRVSPAEQDRLRRRRSVHPDAHEAYLRGRYYWNQRTPMSVRYGIELMERAIALDPEYALAHVGLADAYGVLGYLGAMPAREALPRSRAAALAALALDDSLAEAHSSLGAFYVFHEWDWVAAEASLRRAISQNASYATAHQLYAQYLAIHGRVEEALAEMARAAECDPLSPAIRTGRGTLHYYAGDYSSAIGCLTDAAALAPDFTLAHEMLSRVFAKLGEYDAARMAAARAVDLGGTSSLWLLGYAHACAGHDALAKDVLARVARASETSGTVSPVALAALHASLGDRDGAIRWLEWALEERAPTLVLAGVDPTFDGLRGAPRFGALLSQLGVRALDRGAAALASDQRTARAHGAMSVSRDDD